MDLRSTKSRLNYLLTALLVNLESLNDDKNFFENIDSLKNEINEIEELKAGLKENFNRDDLKELENELNFKAKQIREKFDSIIEEKKREITSVSEQIENLQNSKKLAVYR